MPPRADGSPAATPLWFRVYPLAKQREIIALAISRRRGIMRQVAHELGANRKQCYNLVHAFSLWPVVNAARVARKREQADEARLAKMMRGTRRT